MDAYLYWTLAAIALVIVELITGTFFLLVLAIAAGAGGALAYFAQPLWAQAGFAALIAVLGVVLVHRYRVTPARGVAGSNAIDVGQRVTLDSWVNQAEGLARVRYRGTIWDAKVAGTYGARTDFYIQDVVGSTLYVSAERS